MTYLPNLVRRKSDPKVLRSGPSAITPSDKLARALGWFSIGLGLTELVMPSKFTRALGMEGKEALVQAYGAREIAAGLMSLSPDKHAGMCSRVAGDGVDILTLLSAMHAENPKQKNVLLALAAVLGVTLFDIVGAQATGLSHSRGRGRRRLYHERSGFPAGVAAARGASRNLDQARALRARDAREARAAAR